MNPLSATTPIFTALNGYPLLILVALMIMGTGYIFWTITNRLLGLVEDKVVGSLEKIVSSTEETKKNTEKLVTAIEKMAEEDEFTDKLAKIEQFRAKSSGNTL